MPRHHGEDEAPGLTTAGVLGEARAAGRLLALLAAGDGFGDGDFAGGGGLELACGIDCCDALVVVGVVDDVVGGAGGGDGGGGFDHGDGLGGGCGAC